MKIFVINLERAHARRAAMSEWLSEQQLQHEIFPAVDGAALDPATVAGLYDADATVRNIERGLSPGEIGCALSHRTIWERMLAENLPYALVLEDDAKPKADLRPTLGTLAARLDADRPAAVVLGHTNKYLGWRNRRLSAPGLSCHPLWEGFGTRGYIVTNAGARVLRDILTPLTYPVDYWAWHRRRGLQVFCIVPFVLAPSEHARTSSIAAGRDSAMQRAKRKRTVYEFLKRYAWQKFAWQFVKLPLRVKRQPKR